MNVPNPVRFIPSIHSFIHFILYVLDRKDLPTMIIYSSNSLKQLYAELFVVPLLHFLVQALNIVC